VNHKQEAGQSLPAELFLGAKMIDFCPTAALIPASAAPAFPVEAVTTTSALISRARAITSELALSLKEAVGLRPSSFTHKFSRPNCCDSNAGRYSGVQPADLNGVPSRPDQRPVAAANTSTEIPRCAK